MKKIKIGLLPRIIIAIILGIAIGTIFPAPLVRIFVTFNGIFSEFLNFSIPLIIVGLVTVAIADIGKGAGKDAACHRPHRLRPQRSSPASCPTSPVSPCSPRSSKWARRSKKSAKRTAFSPTSPYPSLR